MIRTNTKHLLRRLMYVLCAIGGLAFLFGGVLIHIVWNLDRFLGELIGIALAFACLICGAVANHVIDDIEWREANEEAAVSDRKAGH